MDVRDGRGRLRRRAEPASGLQSVVRGIASSSEWRVAGRAIVSVKNGRCDGRVVLMCMQHMIAKRPIAGAFRAIRVCEEIRLAQ